MDIPKIHESEYRFCLILWENEPVSAPELVRLCQERLGWKRTTTYTSLVSKDQVQAAEIDELVEKKFGGSLPAFVAAFAKRQDLSEAELNEVQHMIDRIRKGGAR